MRINKTALDKQKALEEEINALQSLLNDERTKSNQVKAVMTEEVNAAATQLRAFERENVDLNNQIGKLRIEVKRLSHFGGVGGLALHFTLVFLLSFSFLFFPLVHLHSSLCMSFSISGSVAMCA